KNTARMGVKNGLITGPVSQKSKFNLRKKERMLQNKVLQHPLCLHSEARPTGALLYYRNYFNDNDNAWDSDW
ncbi:MAG: hypothetical protein IJK13_00345, partial [Lachnospiraceae bacterium]|nr:hypothetical protein [Lachnospiraceae bacterium]